MNMITKCERCNVNLRQRKTPPKTAMIGDEKYYDYWQCPICKTNYANPKQSYMAVDQYGKYEQSLGAQPKEELLKRYNVKTSQPLIIDGRIVGWVIAGHWFTVFLPPEGL
jgi:rubredoxin